MVRTFARLLATVTIAFALAVPAAASSNASSASHPTSKSRSKSKSGTTHSKTHASSSKTGHHKSPSAKRDSHGKIARSEAAKHEFEVQSGYPHGRPGYVVDHITPLACGGADIPSNMQWQTTETAKLKDKTERAGCR